MNEGFLQKKPGVPRVIQVTTIGITAYRALLAQGRYFRAKGLEVGFVFSPSPEGELLRCLQFPVKEIGIDRRINPRSDLNHRRLYRYFLTVQPDIVHTHTSKAGVGAGVSVPVSRGSHVILRYMISLHPGMPG